MGAVRPKDSGLHPRAHAEEPVTTIPPVSGDRDREPEPDEVPERTLERLVKRARSESPESTSPRERISRAPVRVDEVGDAAVLLGARHGRAVAVAAPRVLRTRRELENAPINHRDAFVLSLIDGRTSVQGIVDLAAMPDGEVVSILTRLATLGIISMP